MKLKFNEQIKTSLDIDTLQKNIISRLKEEKYEVTRIEEKKIFFKKKTAPWKIEPRSISTKFDKGMFEINRANKESEIQLTYYISIIIEIILIPIIIIVALIIDYFYLILSIGFIIQFIIRFFLVKSKGKELLSKVVGTVLR